MVFMVDLFHRSIQIEKMKEGRERYDDHEFEVDSLDLETFDINAHSSVGID